MYIYGIKKQYNETQYLIDLLKSCDDVLAGNKGYYLPEPRYLKLWHEVLELNDLSIIDDNGILFDINHQVKLDDINNDVIVVGTQKIFNGTENTNMQIWEIFYDMHSAKLFTYALDPDYPIYIFDAKDNQFEKYKNEKYMENKIKEESMLGPRYFKGDILITDPCYIVKNRDESKKPKWNDYFDHMDIREYTDYDGNTSKTFMEHMKNYDEAYEKWKCDVVDDRDLTNNYIDMDVLGFTQYLTHYTLYGDWSCSVFNDKNDILGHFCADAGMVGVFLADEVLKYNPDFISYLEKEHIVTVIKNFDGYVRFDIIDDETLIVVGEGNINFKSKQTGF